MERLLELAKKEKIQVIWTDKLSQTTPPVVSIKQRCIIMNSNWKNHKQTIFQLAHEIAHIIYCDPTDLYLYNRTPAQKLKIESATNNRALKLMLEIYALPPITNINIINFMQDYQIPAHLESHLCSLIKNMC